MRGDLVRKRIEAAKIRIADRFSQGACYELSQDTLARNVATVFAWEDVRTLPSWARDELRGYTDAFWSHYWRHVVWILYDAEGNVTTDVRKAETGRHVYLDTFKPFTEKTTFARLD